ncbi:ANTAR domain-containing response regulator [Methylophaga sp. OBS4]|uniref:ANTAR domain-containing response regulator n=1 Tax=Methylophaga sp. OBS4 TaxID=2991935 RepID=UPI00225B68D8|nr:ANTAR domain-containing protein [Methylophaga sp. OBS4]MCX4188117.1 ANTAR domain-containing protein [Methylophaga sp. OBS4]
MSSSTVINTIVISEQPQTAAKLKAVLNDSDYKVIFEGSNLQQLLTLKWRVEPELIIAVMETSDSQVLSKFKVINEQFPLPIVIFTHDDRDDAIEQAIEAGVSAYIVDGFREDRVQPILRTAMARFRQYRSMQKQLQELRTSLADRKIIDRAKGLIMQQRQCSEDEAYRLLRTSAMNQNMRLAALAQNILATADLLEPRKTV